jgi:hypothetical protein
MDERRTIKTTAIRLGGAMAVATVVTLAGAAQSQASAVSVTSQSPASWVSGDGHQCTVEVAWV